jgi:outer membrane protein TolC
MRVLPSSARRFRLTAILLLWSLARAAPPPGAPPHAPSIDEALSLARTSSEAVRMKSLEVLKSSDRLAEAKARAFPSLILDASGSYLANPPAGITLTTGELGRITTPIGTLILPPSDVVVVEDAEHTYFKANATLSQPLLTWGKIPNAIALADREVAVSGAELVRQQRDVEKQAHAAYFGALLAEESLPLLREMKRIGEAVLRDRRSAFEAGASTRQEVLEAEAGLASLSTKLIQAEESRTTALEGLSLLTGAALNDTTLSTSFRASLPGLDEPSLKAAAVKSYPELQSARERAAQARTKLSLEKGGAMLLPDLSLAVSLGVKGQKIPFSSSDWSDTWDWDLIVSLGARANLFDAGASWARIREAGRDVEGAALGIAGLEKAIGARVRAAVQQAREKSAAVEEAKAKAALAEEQAKNARVSFENELATREEMNRAALGFLSARLAVAGARHDLEAALEDIEYLTGERLGGT